jgi:hypothetical protein
MTPMMVAIGGRSGVPASHLQQLDLQARNHQPRFPGGRQAVPFGRGRELRARRSCRASASPLRVSPFDRAWDLSTCPNRFAPRCLRARTSARRSCSAIGSNCCAPTPPTCRQRSSWRDGRIAAPCLNFFGHALSDHERTYLHSGRRLLPGSRLGRGSGPATERSDLVSLSDRGLADEIECSRPVSSSARLPPSVGVVSSPDGRSGRCSRRGSARGSPGARALPPRTVRRAPVR